MFEAYVSRSFSARQAEVKLLHPAPMNQKKEAYIRVVIAMTKAGPDDLLDTSDKSAYYLRGIIDYAVSGKKANLNLKWAPSTYRYSAKAALLKNDKSAYEKRTDKSQKHKKLHAEHIIPNIMVFTKLVDLVREGKSDDELASFLRENCQIVVITKSEVDLLDGKNSGLKKNMPDGWKWGDDPYARLSYVGIELE